jgi:hypothetical protein
LQAATDVGPGWCARAGIVGHAREASCAFARIGGGLAVAACRAAPVCHHDVAGPCGFRTLEGGLWQRLR